MHVGFAWQISGIDPRPLMGIIALTCILALAGRGEAQTAEAVAPSSIELDVLIAAAEYGMTGLDDGRNLPLGSAVILDPAMPGRGLLGFGESRGTWDGDVVRRIAERIGATAGDGGPYRECNDAPVLTCRLTGVDAVMRLGSPRIDGDRAVIPVLVIYRSPPAPDPYEAHYTLTVYRLERGADGWEILGAAMTQIS